MKAKILLAASAASDHVVLGEIEKFGTIEKGESLGDHHLVVVGVEDAAGDLVRNALDKQRGIVVLDASASAKVALRDAGVGFSTDGACLAYFVQKRSASRMRVIEIPIDGLHFEEGGSSGGGEASGEPSPEPPPELGAFAAAPDHPETICRFATYLFESLRVTADDDANGSIPSGVKYLQILFTSTNSTTNNGQVSTLDVNSDVYGFLNDPPKSDPFQILFLETTALANPGTQKSYSTYTKGWVQHELDYSATLIPTPSVQFGLFGHAPQNTAKETTVTGTLGFDVGFKIAKDPGATGSFNFSRSKTEVITDWEVIDQSAGLMGRWTYAQMKPFSGIGKTDCCASVSGCPFTFWITAAGYGTLSRYALTANTMATWRSTSVTSSVIDIDTSAQWRLGYYQSYVGLLKCEWGLGNVQKTLSVDFAKFSDS